MSYKSLTELMIDRETLSFAKKNGFKVTVERDHDTSSLNPRNYGSSSTIVTSTTGQKAFSDKTLSDNMWGNSVFDAAENYALINKIDFRDMLCITIYGHRDGTLSLSSKPSGEKWDNGVVGFIFESRAAIRAEFNVKRIGSSLNKDIVERLEREIAEVSTWLSKDYFVVSVKNDKGDEDSRAGIASENSDYTSQVALEIMAALIASAV